MSFIGCMLHNAIACNNIGMVNTMTSNDYIVVAGALLIGICGFVLVIIKR